MKKFLSKKSTKILFIILTVAVTIAYISLLVRPISYGMSYTNETTTKLSKTVTEVTFQSSKKMNVKTKTTSSITGETTKEVEYWVYCQDGKAAIVGLTSLIPEESYNKATDTKEEKENLIKLATYKLNAFGGEGLEGEYKCTGALILAIVAGVVELVLITFTALTFVCATKKTKKTSKKKK